MEEVGDLALTGLGGALATILSQTVSALWVLLFLLGRRTQLHLRARHLRLKPAVLLPVVAIGVSPFIMQSTESLVSISFDSSLKLYGNDAYVGAMTIASSVMQVAVMPLHGLTQGAQPIIGFNYGAGALERVRRAFRLLLISCVTLTVTIWALVELSPASSSPFSTTSRSLPRSPGGRCGSILAASSSSASSPPASRPLWRWERPRSPSSWPCCGRSSFSSPLSFSFPASSPTRFSPCGWRSPLPISAPPSPPAASSSTAFPASSSAGRRRSAAEPPKRRERMPDKRMPDAEKALPPRFAGGQGFSTFSQDLG